MQTKTTEMKKMFGWYDPVALLRAAGDVVYSSINGRHADHRLIEAITPINAMLRICQLVVVV